MATDLQSKLNCATPHVALTFDLYMAMDLLDLAAMALEETRPIHIRMAAQETLNARIRDCAANWTGYDESEKAILLGAMALDLSADGFTQSA